RPRHVVATVVMDGIHPFEMSVPCEVFGLERPEVVYPWPYELVVVSTQGTGPVRTHNGFSIETPHTLADLERADTVVVPSWPNVDQPPDESLLAALRAAHQRGARIMSFCSGAFVLGYAGLLDGRRAATHWMYADAMAARFPAVSVDRNVLYVDEGDVLTSAGTAAAIDLCLHVIRQDLGAEAANIVARRMVVPPHRDGGQAQYVQAPVPACPAEDPIAGALDWAVEHLDEPLSVEALARVAAMSPRTFARRFRDVTGTTPHQWLLRQRVLHAQRLLETTDEPVERVANRCGFSSAAVLREHFTRVTGTNPLTYRRTFRAA
ncbi:MAG TPA: helix-turn-helix domain-containing protein, partial [Acidimicrobiales bacterium]|nr:helix-turn-helix domain-containing protein [Acidimicrobiales bacterium]